MSTARINRPKEAANILLLLSKVAMRITLLTMLFMGIIVTVTLREHGAIIVLLGLAMLGLFCCVQFLLILFFLVERWQRIQFFFPLPQGKRRSIPVTTRGRTEILTFDDRVGG